MMTRSGGVGLGKGGCGRISLRNCVYVMESSRGDGSFRVTYEAAFGSDFALAGWFRDFWKVLQSGGFPILAVPAGAQNCNLLKLKLIRSVSQI
ncbi:hypothetical protein R1flu_011920 [Riccia fluitans]|uniref:LAGLIDADG homing endonuclease n=1 Tax=Riccia fluitans TaxID=41844 RepID=A0ABD1Z9D8_9MARC